MDLHGVGAPLIIRPFLTYEGCFTGIFRTGLPGWPAIAETVNPIS